MLESLIEKKVVAYCKTRGLLTYKFTSPNNRGVPDRVIMGDGLLLFMELKQLGKKPTPLQQYEHQRITKAGQIVVTADSFDAAMGYIETFFGK